MSLKKISGFTELSAVSDNSWVLGYEEDSNGIKSNKRFKINEIVGNYLPLTGGTVTGPIQIKSTVNNNYNEGLRIMTASNGWAGITFGGVAGLQGAPTNGWFAARNPNNYFIISPDDNLNTTGLKLVKNGEAYWRNDVIITAGNQKNFTFNRAKYVYSNDIQEGGDDLIGVSPISMALSASHAANRLAFANPEGLVVERSHNYTSETPTWEEATVSDAAKINLMSGITNSTDFRILTSTGASYPITPDDALRLTLSAQNLGIYCRATKLMMNVGTSDKCNLKIEYAYGNKALNGEYKAITATEWVTYKTIQVAGWSGWNDIVYKQVFGGGPSLTSQPWFIRLTFYKTADQLNTSTESYKFFILYDLALYSSTYWSYPSTMAKNGHLYSYGSDKSATFPNSVTAPNFYGTFSGNILGQTGKFLKDVTTTFTTPTNNNTNWVKTQHDMPFEVGRASNNWRIAMGCSSEGYGVILNKGTDISSYGYLFLQPLGKVAINHYGAPHNSTLFVNGDITANTDITASGKLSVTGTSTLTGAVTANGGITASSIKTNSLINESWVHRIEFGRSSFDHMDFYEYGGVYNFYKCTDDTGVSKTLVGKIDASGYITAGTGFKVTGKDTAATAGYLKSDGTVDTTLTSTVTVTNGTSDLAWGTDVTVGTVNGTAITAKLPTKPSYAWNDITSKPTSFSPSSHTHSLLSTEGDNRSVATTPNDYTSNFRFRGLKNKTVIGSPSTDGYSYLLGLRGWEDSSGGQSHEIAFNNTGIFVRKEAASNTWGTWSLVAMKSDIEANTDTKVTSVGNHYTPSGGSNLAATNTDSGTLTSDSSYVVTGVTVVKDAAGHVTGLRENRSKLPAVSATDSKTSSANNTDKMYLVGAAEQSSSGQTTYSHSNVYAENGNLHSTEVTVSERTNIVYDSTLNCLKFTFI